MSNRKVFIYLIVNKFFILLLVADEFLTIHFTFRGKFKRGGQECFTTSNIKHCDVKNKWSKWTHPDDNKQQKR